MKNKEPQNTRPTIVCLCGSTRFSEAFAEANFQETLQGRIVLSVGCDTKSDGSLFGDLPVQEQALIKEKLDVLHLHKINLADEILVLNVDGYCGESTSREVRYAIAQRKKIRWLQPGKIPEHLLMDWAHHQL